MATITVRNLDEETKNLLRLKASRSGRSLEEEVRLILAKAVNPSGVEKGLGTEIHNLFAKVGGTDDLPVYYRDIHRPPPDFADW